MKFYDLLQMDPAGLKRLIRQAGAPAEKRRLYSAMALRSLLTVLFSVAVISPAASLFGPQNSAMAVSMLCILLGLRFVDFGCRIRDSLVNLAIVFALLLLAPAAAAAVHPLPAGLIHVSAFFVILFMTCEKPEMGNAGLYSFAYIYLAGNPVSGVLLWKRAELTLVWYLICAAVMYAKHRHKNQGVSFLSLAANFRLSGKKYQWQLQLALGVGILLSLGSLVGLKRTMWAAFACSAVLGCCSVSADGVRERLRQRMAGTLAGTLIFFLLYQVVPESFYPMFGLLGGLVVGFCADYRYKTACNSLGALLVATGLYGLQQSVFLRVMNNFLGVVFACGFLFLFQKLMRRFSRADAQGFAA